MNPLRAIAVSSAIGLELAVCMVGGYYLGRFLDVRFATTPWFTIAALIVGLVMGVWGTYKLVVYFLDE